MSNFATALGNLAALSVSGVRGNFGIGSVPEQPDRSVLPALILIPADRDDRPSAARGDGLKLFAFGDAGATFTAAVTHLLLIAPQGSGIGVREYWPPLANIIDAYFSALKGDPLMGGALAQPARVQVEAGIVEYANMRYIGAAFRHLWTMGVV